MRATVDRDTALELLDEEHSAVRALIDELTDEEKTRPDTIEYGLYPDQELSFKDLLAHLICYEAYALEAIDAWRQGEKHWISDAMRSPARSREVHYEGIECRRPMSLEAVLEEWERTQGNLMAAIRSIGDEAWRSPAPYPTSEPTDLGGMLEAILVAPPRPMYRHLPVHIPDSDTYVRKLRR
jgi:hypothetical protein